MKAAYLAAHLLQKLHCLALYEEFSQLVYLGVKLRLIQRLVADVVAEVEVFLRMVFVDLLLFLEGLGVEESQPDEGFDGQGLEGGLEVLELDEDGEQVEH